MVFYAHPPQEELIFDNVKKFPKESHLSCTSGKVVLEHHWVVWILPVNGKAWVPLAQQWIWLMITALRVRQRTYQFGKTHCRYHQLQQKIGGR